MDQARKIMIERLRQDLVGPVGPEEVLTERPSEVYLTGILFPRDSEVPPEEEESLETGADSGDQSNGGKDSVSLSATFRPSTAGVSFALSADGGPRISVVVSCGTYREEEHTVAGSSETNSDDMKADTDGEAERTGVRPGKVWRRTAHKVEIPNLAIKEGGHYHPLDEYGLGGLQLYVQVSPARQPVTVTAALVNTNEAMDTRADREEKSFFQARMEVRAGKGARIEPRPAPQATVRDEDGLSANLIYRESRQYGVGHTCSCSWRESNGQTAIATEWLPEATVLAMNPNGDECFQALREDDDLQPLSSRWLSDAGASDLTAGLAMLPDAYERWIGAQEARAPSLEGSFAQQAELHMERCRTSMQRMRDSIEFLKRSENARTAFQLANRAITLQRSWLRDEEDLTWRPFQLAFQLQVLSSLLDVHDEDRDVMDLLWFPTGGGKTEAYLSLMAATLIHRRLREDDPDDGAGVAVLTRYTLRLLTIQQFERTSALVLACESIRRSRDDLGDKPFAIGLWVGGGATPNRIEDLKRLTPDSESTHKQLKNCPACGERLRWNNRTARATCRTESCELHSWGVLPVFTVDELIYQNMPSVVIGTIDKFVQVTRNVGTGALFGMGTPYAPPEFIIQDELHLISGPLGTIAGLYEIAIDRLCEVEGIRPKVIGSTATIRRASEQVTSLFDRNTFQFPPPGIDHDNSGFAVLDHDAPGRLYVGVTSAGRSPKFTLQAICASLLQAVSDPTMDEEQRDLYWTLVTYFNSLRELGGALVMMQDDVPASIMGYASRREEKPRNIMLPEELTSRKSSREIPDILERLEESFDSGDAYDSVLATNMISVGVDVSRLGLMVVNGQPKTISEYIQATSRVGRGTVPGLVVTSYNAGRARDRSHYETFATWHRTLYREVEATSVTPFASRALDKALHGPLVALARHLVGGLRDRPVLKERSRSEVEKLAELIVERAGRIDPEEVPGLTAKLATLIEEWSRREALQEYWDDSGKKNALMVSAEQHAARAASGATMAKAWPTPNSMREVEPGTPFRLRGSRGIRRGSGDAQTE